MPTEPPNDASTHEPTDPPDCPLAQDAQRRNLLLFACCTGLQYLAAPVSYVGLTQASLCSALGTSSGIANLPETAYLGMTFAPAVLAWLFPQVRVLRRNLMFCYLAAGLSQASVAVALMFPLPAELHVAAVVGQAAIAGLTVPSAIAFLWELIGRGANARSRGLALSLAFGCGPLLAVAGSLLAQRILGGAHLAAQSGVTADFLSRYALLYGLAAPAMWVAAALATRFVVPLPDVEAQRQPFATSIFGGIGDFLRDPLLRTAALVTVLLYFGNMITSNLNLYSEQSMGEAPMLNAGYQNAARFAFKTVAGLSLGWLLTRTNPKAGLLATAAIYTGSIVLAMFLSGGWYILVFGLYGAGELIGVYAPNYILSASRPNDMRRNMALATMLTVPTAPAGYIFGRIADRVGQAYDPSTGFRVSFAVCIGLMTIGILLAIVKLPRWPRGESG